MDFLDGLSAEAIWASVPIMAVVVWILVEYLVKRNITDLPDGKRKLITNISSGIVGILLSLAVAFITTEFTAKVAVWAVVQGLLAGGLATLGAEVRNNLGLLKEERDAP